MSIVVSAKMEMKSRMDKPNLKTGENKATYLSEGKRISALVYVPKDYNEDEKRPAIVVTRPGSGVKEQTAGLYAQKLSKKGFVTLAFDPRGFGESEGHAQVEDPYSIAEDTKNSVSFIRTLPQVDKDNVFNMGICMGAGYAAYATALDARVKGVAMVSPFLDAADQYLQAAGGRDNIRKTILSKWSNARQKYFETGEDTPMKAVPETEEESHAPGIIPVQIGMMTYYPEGQPGSVPTWKNAMAMYNLESLLSFSAFHVTHLLDNVPLFMAYGTDAYTVENNEKFFTEVKGPKDKFVADGADHFDMYYKPEYVDPTLERIAAFFKKHMKQS